MLVIITYQFVNVVVLPNPGFCLSLLIAFGAAGVWVMVWEITIHFSIKCGYIAADLGEKLFGYHAGNTVTTINYNINVHINILSR